MPPFSSSSCSTHAGSVSLCSGRAVPRRPCCAVPAAASKRRLPPPAPPPGWQPPAVCGTGLVDGEVSHGLARRDLRHRIEAASSFLALITWEGWEGGGTRLGSAPGGGGKRDVPIIYITRLRGGDVPDQHECPSGENPLASMQAHQIAWFIGSSWALLPVCGGASKLAAGLGGQQSQPEEFRRPPPACISLPEDSRAAVSLMTSARTS